MQFQHAVSTKIDRHPTRRDAIPHQSVSETMIGGPENKFPQDATMGLHQRKGSIVADRADIAQMVRKAFQFSHESA